MTTISLDDVRYVAALAKIKISDKEAVEFQKELDVILDYVKQLDSVDVQGFSPTYQVTGLTNVMRPDELVDYNVSQSELLKNTPAQQDGQIKVPKVL